MSSLRSRFLLVCAFALLAVPLAAQPRWTAQGPYGGWVESLTVAPSNPDVVYAAIAFEGLFRSLDGGRRWTAVLSGDIEARWPWTPPGQAQCTPPCAAAPGRAWTAAPPEPTWAKASRSRRPTS